jgi:hypothetical protein
MYRSLQDHTILRLEPGANAARYRFEGGGRLRVVNEDGDVLYEYVDPWTPSPAILTSFAGEYASDEAEVTYTVAVKNGQLVARRRPAVEIPLEPTYKDGFNARGLGSVRFLRDQAGKVTAMSIGAGRVWDLRLQRLR